MTTQVFLYGRNGRMGRAIEDHIHTLDNIDVCGGISEGESLQKPTHIDVIIDFSHASVADKALQFARENNTPIVIGTTGTDDAYEAVLEQAQTEIPILRAANMSLGVNVLRYLVQQAAHILPDTWNAEIVELHHNKKTDSPSGTALALLESVNAGRNRAPREGFLGSREGQVGARTQDEIGVFGVRGGNVAGEHTVFFFGEDERIELTHRANNRSIFAQGAVRCAQWLAAQKEPKLYGINDVLGLH